MKKLKYYNFDIVGLSEVNIHWPLVNPAESWEYIISGHWEASNSVMDYNLEDNATKVWQPGGCLQISTARTTHKVLSMGSDTSGLGCWVWTRYQGKHNITLRVITTYITCITKSSGVQTIYRQHQKYLDITNYDRLPKQSMLEDICRDIAQWFKLGDQIVLMVDLNENITSDTVTNLFKNVGLAEAITHRHFATGLVPKYQRGSHPMYGIYTSSTLQISAGGYLLFIIIPSDHRLLWIKFEFDSAFGTKMDTLAPHTVRRLN